VTPTPEGVEQITDRRRKLSSENENVEPVLIRIQGKLNPRLRSAVEVQDTDSGRDRLAGALR
jgi:hypothetical protein